MVSAPVEQHKRCKGPCAGRKPVSEFSPAVRWPDGNPRYFMSYCRECNNKRPRNRKKQRTYARKWARARYRTDPEWRGIILERNREARGAQQKVAGLRLPSDPIREAVERSEITPAEVARRIDKPKSTVAKALKAETIPVALAVAILDAVDVLPASIGL